MLMQGAVAWNLSSASVWFFVCFCICLIALGCEEGLNVIGTDCGPSVVWWNVLL